MNATHRPLISIALFCAMLSSSAWAMTETQTEQQPPFTLQKMLDRLVEHNGELKIQSLERQIAEASVENAQSSFEPTLTAYAKRESEFTRNTVEEKLSRSTYDEYFNIVNETGFTISKAFVTGTNLDFETKLTDNHNNLQSDSTRGREFDTYVGMTLTQPLLKGAGRSVATANLRMSEKDYDIAKHSAEQTRMQVIARAVAAYLDLQLAHQKVALQESSVAIAKKLLSDTQGQSRAGRTARTEVLDAQTGVDLRYNESLNAKQQLATATTALQTLIMDQTDGKFRPFKNVPALSLPELPDLDYEHNMNQARNNRPEMFAARTKMAKEHVRLTYAKNQRLPQLDLNGSYGVNGMATTVNRAFDDAWKGDHASWSVSVTLTSPLDGGRKSKSELLAARSRQIQASTEAKMMEVQIGNTLASTLQRIHSLQSQLKTLKTVEERQEELLAIEMNRLKQGKGNARRVLERETLLNAAKQNHLEHMALLHKARIDLLLTNGTLLEVLNLAAR
ncbi:TolC family protein [Magnetococcus sp. PR-3]|uniref:TolC family protein n=1 Tax=Magnetococcus sp. PR-3 TaxID=3120355 RepID=UPI002FCE5258